MQCEATDRARAIARRRRHLCRHWIPERASRYERAVQTPPQPAVRLVISQQVLPGALVGGPTRLRAVAPAADAFSGRISVVPLPPWAPIQLRAQCFLRLQSDQMLGAVPHKAKQKQENKHVSLPTQLDTCVACAQVTPFFFLLDCQRWQSEKSSDVRPL